MLPVNMSLSSSPSRTTPHRRVKHGYKSPATIKHSMAREKQHDSMLDNFETLNEFYGMDTLKEQFAIQDFYSKFEGFRENGECIHSKIPLDKKRIVWKNPANGISLAALKDVDFEIKLPNFLPTYSENLEKYQSLWLDLDYDLELLFENMRKHEENQDEDYYCLYCDFPFLPICQDLFSQFQPDPP